MGDDPDQLSLIQGPDPNDPANAPPDLTTLNPPDPPQQLVTTQQAQTRAQQYAFATGGDSQAIYQQLLAGDEQTLRKNTAMQQNLAADKQRSDILQDYASRRAQAGVQEPLNPDEVQAITGLTQPQMTNPQTVMENLFAQNVMKNVYPQDNSVRGTAAQLDPHTTDAVQDVAEAQISLNETAKRLLDDLDTAQSSKGLVNQITDIGGQLIPFMSQWNQHNVAGLSQGTSIGTAANNQEQYAYIRGLPPDQAPIALAKAVQTLAGKNALDAQHFLQGFLHYGMDDAALDDITNIADVATIASPALKAVAKTVGGVAEVAGAANRASQITDATKAFANASKGTVAALAVPGPIDVGKVAAASGREDIVAAQKVFTDALAARDGSDPTLLSKALADTLPSLADPGGAFRDASKTTRQYGENISLQMKQNATDFVNLISGGLGARTAGPQQFADAMLIARKAALDEADRASIHDAVLDQKVHYPEDNPLGVGLMETRLGRPDGSMFVNPRQAGIYAKEYGIPDLKIGKNPTAGPTLVLHSTESLKNVAEGLARKGSPATKGKFVTTFDKDGNPTGITKQGRDRAEIPAGSTVVPRKEGSKTKYDIMVKQQGQGYYLSYTRPIKETNTSSLAAEGRLTTINTTPKSNVTTYLDSVGLAGVRTPAERLSSEQRGLRETALNRVSEAEKVLSGIWSRSIGPLQSAEKERVQRFLDFTRRQEVVDPRTGKPTVGVEFKTGGDFEANWLNQFNQLPTERETAAYFGYNQMQDMELYIQDLREYSGRARQGIQQFQFGPKEGWVQGKVVDLPRWDLKDGHTAVTLKDGTTKVFSHATVSGTVKDDVAEMVKNEGYQVVQTVDPFRDEGAPVNYVVTATAKNKNLTADLIPRKPGSHVVLDYPYFGKQSRASVAADGYVNHVGDNVIKGYTTRAQAENEMDALDRARQLYASGDEQGAVRILSNETTLNPESIINRLKNGTLDKNMPTLAVRSGESTFDHPRMQQFFSGNKIGKVWETNELNPLKGLKRSTSMMYKGSYAADAGTGLDELDPMFDLQSARLIDPLPALGQALGRAVRNKFFQNYQIRSAEHFVEEFHSLLQDGDRAEGLAALRENPVEALFHPRWVNNPADLKALAAARGYQDAAVRLMGTQTEQGKYISYVKSWAMDQVFNKGGEAKADFAYEHVLSHIKNPIGFARQVAFTSKLGLFNPVQLVLQAQTMTLAVGIAGFKHGLSGVAGAFLSRLLHISDTPENIEHFAGLASKLGWKPADFKEAYNFMKRSGVFNQGSQLAYRSDNIDDTIFKSGVKQFLHKGEFFFDEGNRANRLTAFMAAYHEWRAANPLAKLDEPAMLRIQDRSGDMSANMTHANASMLNRGLGAVAGQFFSYQERVAELLLGHRLSAAEKARTFVLMGALYGVPTSLAAYTLGGEQLLFPALSSAGVPIPQQLNQGSFYDDVRAELLKRGITNNAFIESLSEGIPETILHVVTGEQYNVGQRLGPNGISLPDNLASGDSLISLAFGASGSIVGSILHSTQPALMDMVDGLQGKGMPPTSLPDFLQALTNISTVSNGMKAYYAIQAGKYFNTSGDVVADGVTGTDGVMMAFLGLTPDKINDRVIMDQAVKAATDAKSAMSKQAADYIQRYLREPDGALKQTYLQKAYTALQLGGFTPTESGNVLITALRNSKTQVQAATQKFNSTFNPPIQQGTP